MLCIGTLHILTMNLVAGIIMTLLKTS